MLSTAAPIKLRNVQALRAYGALAVAFYHTNFTVAHGHFIGSYGVAIFFVISGFIMAMICDTSPEHFLARRVARIVSLYWLLTFFIFIIGMLAPRLMGSTVVDALSLLKSLFFIPYTTNGTYFPILFLGWSLNYEMYFYILIAAAQLIHKPSAALVASGFLAIVFVVIRLSGAGGSLMFYAQPIVFEFVLGVVCYYVFRVVPAQRAFAARWVLVLTASAAALAMIAASLTTAGLTVLSLVGLASTVLVLSAVLLDKAGISFRWPFLILLGDASYVLYLIHPYCIEALNKILAHRYPILATNTLVGMPIALLVTVIASIWMYRFIDAPLHEFFRNLLSKPSRSPRIVVSKQSKHTQQETV